MKYFYLIFLICIISFSCSNNNTTKENTTKEVPIKEVPIKIEPTLEETTVYLIDEINEVDVYPTKKNQEKIKNYHETNTTMFKDIIRKHNEFVVHEDHIIKNVNFVINQKDKCLCSYSYTSYRGNGDDYKEYDYNQEINMRYALFVDDNYFKPPFKIINIYMDNIDEDKHIFVNERDYQHIYKAVLHWKKLCYRNNRHLFYD